MFSRIELVEEQHARPEQGADQHHTMIVIHVQRKCPLAGHNRIGRIENILRVIIVWSLQEVRVPRILRRSIQNEIGQFGCLGCAKPPEIWGVDCFAVGSLTQGSAWHERRFLGDLSYHTCQTIFLFDQTHLRLGR